MFGSPRGRPPQIPRSARSRLNLFECGKHRQGKQMGSVNVKSLVGKLNDICRRALDDAAGLCVSRTHYNVEVEHWILRLLDMPNTDLLTTLAYFGADPVRLKKDLTR